MIRVTYIVDAMYAGGAERYIALILDAIDRGRFEVSVIAGNQSGLDAWCARVAATGVPVTRLPLNLPFHPRDALPLMAVLRSIAPHIVHVNLPGPYNGGMGTIAPIARLAGCSAVVVTEHLPMVERLWKRAAVKRLSYAVVDRVLTICEDNVRYLTGRQRVPLHKIDVVYNGIDASFGSNRTELRQRARDEAGLGDTEAAIVVAGSLIERKGIDTLLTALEGLGGAWRLFVVGSGELAAAHERRAVGMGLETRVRFMGERPIEEVERLLCAADILAVPSFMEGMPYVILEAMACSLPVVASAINGIPEAVADGDTGLLVPSGDAVALRSALHTLIGNDSARVEMGLRGRRRFEDMFTLDRHIAGVESVYLGLLGPHV